MRRSRHSIALLALFLGLIQCFAGVHLVSHSASELVPVRLISVTSSHLLLARHTRLSEHDGYHSSGAHAAWAASINPAAPPAKHRSSDCPACQLGAPALGAPDQDANLPVAWIAERLRPGLQQGQRPVATRAGYPIRGPPALS